MVVADLVWRWSHPDGPVDERKKERERAVVFYEITLF
jgi:hypothetical protein